MKWILILVLSRDVLIPVGIFETHEQCLKVKDAWELDPSVDIVCAPGTIDEEGAMHHRKRHR